MKHTSTRKHLTLGAAVLAAVGVLGLAASAQAHGGGDGQPGAFIARAVIGSPGYTAPQGHGDEIHPGETLQTGAEAVAADAKLFASSEGIDAATATREIRREQIWDSRVPTVKICDFVVNPHPYSITLKWVGLVPAATQGVFDAAGLSVPVNYDTDTCR